MKTILIALSSLLLAAELSAQIVVPPGNYLFQRRQNLPATGYDPKPFPPVAMELISFDSLLNPVTTPISTYGRTLIQSASASALANSLLPAQVAGEFLSTDGTNWVMADALKPGQVSGSLVVSGGFLTLSGDTGTPGNSFYYGTNGSGTKGWYTLPSQVNADWNSVSGPSQILNKPSIPAAQVNADWNAVSGVAQILNRPTLALVATSGAYSDLSGPPTVVSFFTNDANYVTASSLSSTLSGYATTSALTSGLAGKYNAPSGTTLQYIRGDGSLSTFPTAVSSFTNDANYVTSASLSSTLTGYATTSALTSGLAAKFNTPSGSTAQYLRGDGSLATFPTAVSAFTNDSGYLTGITSGQVTTALGFTPYNATNPSGFVSQSGARTAISLTTTGTSGAATYNSSTGVLNVPNYAVTSGTVTSVGLSSTDLSVSGSPITTSGSITANLTTTGVSAGTYTSVTVDTKGRVTAGTGTTINNNVSRSLSNGTTNQFTISATQRARVNYSITFNFTVTALLGSMGAVYLEFSTDGGTNWTTVSQCTKSFALGLALSGSDDLNLSGEIPANALVRLRATNTGGSSTTLGRAQEVLY